MNHSGLLRYKKILISALIVNKMKQIHRCLTLFHCTLLYLIYFKYVLHITVLEFLTMSIVIFGKMKNMYNY